jgi:hypothetical protein
VRRCAEERRLERARPYPAEAGALPGIGYSRRNSPTTWIGELDKDELPAQVMLCRNQTGDGAARSPSLSEAPMSKKLSSTPSIRVVTGLKAGKGPIPMTTTTTTTKQKGPIEV